MHSYLEILLEESSVKALKRKIHCCSRHIVLASLTRIDCDIHANEQSNLFSKMPVTNLKTSLENKAFFVRLSKIGTARHSREQQFAKLSTSRQQELEELYKGHSPRYSKVAKTDKMANLLVQILQVQEVQTIKEYTLNGYTFKVHVLEDTEL